MKHRSRRTITVLALGTALAIGCALGYAPGCTTTSASIEVRTESR